MWCSNKNDFMPFSPQNEKTWQILIPQSGKLAEIDS